MTFSVNSLKPNAKRHTDVLDALHTDIVLMRPFRHYCPHTADIYSVFKLKSTSSPDRTLTGSPMHAESGAPDTRNI